MPPGRVALALILACLVHANTARAQALDCLPSGSFCDELNPFCPLPCPQEPPGVTYTGDGGAPRPNNSMSPGAQRAATVMHAIINTLRSEFNFGSLLTHLGIPRSVVDAWADDWADGFDQDEISDQTYARGYELRTVPDTPAPPNAGVAAPVDQGGPRTPAPDGRSNNTPQADETKADPVNPANGEFYIEHVDLAFPGFGVTFTHERTYRSRIDYAGPLGPGWDFSYNRRLLNVPDPARVVDALAADIDYQTTGLLPDAFLGVRGASASATPTCGPQVLYMTGEGTTLRFRQVGETDTLISYESTDGVLRTLRGHKQAGQITWSLTEPSGIVEKFDVRGLLVRVEDLNGVGLTLLWEAAGDDWRVTSVTDSVGRVIDYTYSSNGRLTKVVEPASGLQAVYGYSSSRLANATDSTGRKESYEYDFDAVRGGGDWQPEGWLTGACELACAPSESSCDAGGACDAVVASARAECRTSCTPCFFGCIGTCSGSCDTTCTNGIPPAPGRPGTPGCVNLCDADCDADGPYQPTIDAYCQEAWDDYGRDACREGGEDVCETAFTADCDTLAGCLVEATLLTGGAQLEVERLATCLWRYRHQLDAIPDALVSIGASLWDGLSDVFECGGSFLIDCVFTFWNDCDPDCDFDRAEEGLQEMCGQFAESCCRDGEECDEASCNFGHTFMQDCEAAFMGNDIENDCLSPGVSPTLFDPPLLAGSPEYDAAVALHGSVDRWAEENGCAPELRKTCADRCTDDCASACRGDCQGVCVSECATVCHAGDCAGYCDSLRLADECETGCVDGCLASAHESGPFLGPKYGHPRDLNFNIVRIRDGNDAIYLDIEYGTDISRPDFDAVVAQTFGDFAAEIHYRDLAGEARGDVTPPTSGPGKDYVVASLEDFTPVEICPSACNAPPARPPSEYVPSAGGYLVEFVDNPARLGGMAMATEDAQPAPMPPNVLLLSRTRAGVHARSTAESQGPPAGPQPAPFDVVLPQGTVTFAPAGRSFSATGRSEALDALAQLGSVTVLSDRAGRTRVYPGHPRSIARIARGRCREPFRASIASGTLQLSPGDACSAELEALPLASLVSDAALKAGYASSGNAALDDRNLFQPSPMVPLRQPMAWRLKTSGPAGHYEAFAGAGAPAGDVHRAVAVNAAHNLPMSAAPTGTDNFAGPLYVSHDSDYVTRPDVAAPGWRPKFFEGTQVPVEDSTAVAEASNYCPPNRPPPQHSDSGSGPMPVRATVMVDFYGVPWTYYIDKNGRAIRELSFGPGGLRKDVNYNANGQIDGSQGPLDSRTCYRYTASGDLHEVFELPMQDEVQAEGIRRRFGWVSVRGASRLSTVYDPRSGTLDSSPTAVFESFAWDANGNLASVTNGAGETTTVQLVGGSGPERAMPAIVTNPAGAKTRFEYDTTSGGIAKVSIGGDAVVVETDYDAAGRPISQRSPLGEETTLVWSGGRLQSSTRSSDGLSETTSYGYDSDGQVVTVDRGDRQTTYTYDALGMPRRIRTTALDGSAPTTTTCTRYGPGLRLLEEVSPEGNRFAYAYNVAGELLHADAGSLPSSGAWDDACVSNYGGTAASGRLITLNYDIQGGRLSSVVDALGILTTFYYDGLGRVVITSRGPVTGSQTVFRTGYDRLGNIAWRSASPLSTFHGPPQWGVGLQAAEEFSYDSAGRLNIHKRWHFDEGGTAIGDGYATTTYDHDGVDATLTVTDDAGHSTTYRHDAAGRVDRITLPNAAVITRQYSNGGRTIFEDAPAPTGRRRTTTNLTGWGAVASVTTADTGADLTLASFVYDIHRRPIAAHGPDGHRRTTGYDALDRVRTLTHDVGGTTIESVTLGWNRNDWLLSHSSDSGVHTAAIAYAYDALGRLRQRTDPRGKAASVNYIGASTAPASAVDERGVSLLFAYDVRGNMTQLVADPPGNGNDLRRTFSFDGLDRLTLAKRENGIPAWTGRTDLTTTQGWDSLGNLLWSQDNDNLFTRLYTHDGRGLLTGLQHGTIKTLRTYDSLGRLASVYVPPPATASTSPMVQFEYGPTGPPRRRIDGNRAGQTVATTDFTYDELGRLVESWVKRPDGGTIARSRWSVPLDSVPRIARHQRGEAAGLASVFTVDRAGRLLSETHGIAGLPALSIPPGTATMAANETVQPHVATTSSWTRYILDGRHNFFSVQGPGGTSSPTVRNDDAYTNFAGRAFTYDDAGSTTSDGLATYTWDAFGDLAYVDAGAAGRRSYVRDAFGRVAYERDETAGSGNPVTAYGHDGPRRASAKLPQGTTQHIVGGQSLDEHLFRVDTDGTRFFYHQERSGNVYLITDLAGNPAEWYRHTAYGDVTIQSPAGGVLNQSAVANRFGYQGHVFDPRIGLVDMRNRTYRPSLARFLSRDPIGLLGGTNHYAFVDSSPLLYTDPFGLGKESNSVLPDMSAPTSTLERGYLYEHYDEAKRAADNPNNSWPQRVISGVLATAASPLALLEEHVVRQPVNQFVNAGTAAGEHAARAHLFHEQGETAQAIAEGLHATVNASVGVATGIGLASPAAGTGARVAPAAPGIAARRPMGPRLDELGAPGGGGDGRFVFAHGTSPSSAASIVDDGLNAAKAAAASRGGTLAQPGSFFSFQLGPSHAPGPGLQLAYEFGLRMSARPSVVIGTIPASLQRSLVERGLMTFRTIAGSPIPEAIISPAAFDEINEAVKWTILKP